VGDHGCEYMTGGRGRGHRQDRPQLCSGHVGRRRYVLDEERRGAGPRAGGFEPGVATKKMVQLFPLTDTPRKSRRSTASWSATSSYNGQPASRRFSTTGTRPSAGSSRVVPNDYRRVIEAQARMREKGLSQEEAEMAAFDENVMDARRVAGN